MSFGEDFEQLKRDFEAAQLRIKELETELNRPSQAKSEVSVGAEVTPINEADVTLRRLVQRIAMILQAEKIVIMFYDREQGELIGIPPSYGVDEAHLKVFRMRATHGLSGQVFREGEAIIFQDAMTDPRTKEDPFGLLNVSNGVTVPLVIEKRDEENRVVERSTIGVLHAFNKRHGEDFIDEDVRLLERMARNVGSIIANLQMYREVVEEREELVQTFEALSAGLILVSPEGRLSQINGTARAIFGVGAEAIGKPGHEMIESEPLWHLLDEVAQGNEGGKEEIPVSIHGADYIYEVQAAQVKNEDSKDLGIVAIFNDVTDIRNIDKMKSSFVAMASHELRTPLTAIKGFSSTLLDGLDEEIYGKEDQREFLGIVVSECDRLRRLIDDLLNTSRIEAGESLKPDYSEFAFPQLLQKVVAVQQQASNKHQVVLDVEGPLPSDDHRRPGQARSDPDEHPEQRDQVQPERRSGHRPRAARGRVRPDGSRGPGSRHPEGPAQQGIREVPPDQQRRQPEDLRHRPRPVPYPPPRHRSPHGRDLGGVGGRAGFDVLGQDPRPAGRREGARRERLRGSDREHGVVDAAIEFDPVVQRHARLLALGVRHRHARRQRRARFRARILEKEDRHQASFAVVPLALREGPRLRVDPDAVARGVLVDGLEGEVEHRLPRRFATDESRVEKVGEQGGCEDAELHDGLPVSWTLREIELEGFQVRQFVRPYEAVDDEARRRVLHLRVRAHLERLLQTHVEVAEAIALAEVPADRL